MEVSIDHNIEGKLYERNGKYDLVMNQEKNVPFELIEGEIKKGSIVKYRGDLALIVLVDQAGLSCQIKLIFPDIDPSLLYSCN